MSHPKAIIFDLGKVLLDFDYSIAARRIAERCQTPLEEINRHIGQSPLLFRYETGLLTTDEFYREVCGLTGFGDDQVTFSGFFGDIFSPIEPMVQLQADLRARGYRTYIFSNTNDLAIGHIRRNFPFFANFDGYIYSYEHGSMKPDAKLYEIVEETAGYKGADLLYLDDRPENIEAGGARGWQTILHESFEKTRAAMRKLGLM
jgi:HAD superfamily hydrolase (TIGR01509 family)